MGQSLLLDSRNTAAIGLLQRDLNVSGSDQNDQVMISGGNTADGGIGEDLLIHYAEPGNPLPAHFSGGIGDDRLIATGGTTVASGGDGNDNAFARGRFSFYGDSGEDALHLDDLEGEKFFADFDLFDDDVIISRKLLKSVDGLEAHFDYQHLTFHVTASGQNVLSVSLGHETADVLGIDASGQLIKDNVLAYVISEAQDQPLSRDLAHRFLSKYFSDQTSGTDLFLEGLMPHFSGEHDVHVMNGFDEMPLQVNELGRRASKAELVRVIRQAPVIESALNPCLKLVSPKADKLEDLNKKDLKRIYQTYRQALALYESNMIFSSSGTADGVLTLPDADGDQTAQADIPRHWGPYSDLAVSVVAGLFRAKFAPSSAAPRDALTGLSRESGRFSKSRSARLELGPAGYENPSSIDQASAGSAPVSDRTECGCGSPGVLLPGSGFEDRSQAYGLHSFEKPFGILANDTFIV